MTTLVAQILANGGYSCTEPEPDLEHHAWSFSVTKDNESIYVQVNDIYETELIVMAQETKGCLWFSGGSEHAKTLLEYLMAEMKKDDRFGEFKWERWICLATSVA